MSKTAKLKAYLQTGASVTPKQIKSMFKIANPSAAIFTLRQEGLCVYSNEATLYTGEKTTKYRVGAPSKRMVALAAQFGAFDKR